MLADIRVASVPFEAPCVTEHVQQTHLTAPRHPGSPARSLRTTGPYRFRQESGRALYCTGVTTFLIGM
ncbi:hypothetical protein EYF80_058634 [Liparis tanakae]|uniref:Uncharacterized protein n=1 Tax=Liparis tanakae TaxID=230148 RepID=A0A4Z2EQM6_9TELE|nr:hypothetical protein EYF80_058634 [Liparis tanakae]